MRGSRSAWRRDEPATCRVCRLPMWKSEDWTLFVGETAAFVERLVAGDVGVEFHLLPGLVHGFDCCGMLSWAQKAMEPR